MKVCLRKGYHAVYDELVNSPPQGIDFVLPKFTASKRKGIWSKAAPLDWLKRQGYLFVVRDLLRMPNVISINPEGCDVIHSCGGIIPLNSEPWVMDIEHAASFVGFQKGRLEHVHKKVEAYLSRPACKKLMPWSEASVKSMQNALDTRGFKDRMEVVYPAMKMPEKKWKKKKSDKVRLLFVSMRFETKGGMELLEAWKELDKKYDIELTVISDVPKEVREKYSGVVFKKANIPRQKLLKEHFSQADVFVMPSYMDTFGLVYLEAMAFGMPVIGSNVFAVPEIVGKAGLCVDVSSVAWYDDNFLFSKKYKNWEHFCSIAGNPANAQKAKQKITKELITQTSKLIANTSLRNKMGKTGTKEVAKGKFSIQKRNKQLKKIYEEARK